jgi:hypothetical protein
MNHLPWALPKGLQLVIPLGLWHYSIGVIIGSTFDYETLTNKHLE